MSETQAELPPIEHDGPGNESEARDRALVAETMRWLEGKLMADAELPQRERFAWQLASAYRAFESAALDVYHSVGGYSDTRDFIEQYNRLEDLLAEIPARKRAATTDQL